MSYFYKTAIKDNCGFKEPADIPETIEFCCCIENDYYIVKTDAVLPLKIYKGDTSKMFPEALDKTPPTEEKLELHLEKVLPNYTSKFKGTIDGDIESTTK